MKFRDITPTDIGAVLSLYDEAFPPEERRVYSDAADFAGFMAAKENFGVLIAEDESGTFAGFLTYWRFPEFVYVEHFAVSPALRGQGIGRRMLTCLFDTAGRQVLLEVEPPVTGIARRRIAFYESCGFRVRDEIDYVQPPYAPGLPPVPLLLMTSGEVRLDDPSVLRRFRNTVYGCLE